ncbi:helix-turn-helix domain-containing protein [Aurantiacibacter suaedae]|uniref:helix-turn-helix domain-containing protein n=1 Tax=Aurantiacibacter suaedae TaxID=2545755 RepID=UPI0010F9AD4C|nr:helix-turn-helix transcriptional regulator [Aurantiacibacter suaedae]
MKTEEKLARLTEREKVCLREWLQHKSAKEIAADLQISHHAVEKRLKMARTKLGTTSSLQAARLLNEAEGYGPTVAQTPDFTTTAHQSHAVFTWSLILGAIAVITIATALALFLLSQSVGEEKAYQDAVRQNRQEEKQLERALTNIIAVAEVGPDGEVFFTEALSDQRYLQPQSGHYWQISGTGHYDLRSRSLWDRNLEVRYPQASGKTLYYASNQFPNEPLRVAQRSIFLPGSDVEWQFIVTRSREAPN